jgi:hypothetical protein
VPPVYRWLAVHGAGEPVLELPVGVDSLDYGTMALQSRYTYFSTWHWQPLLNGYGGYPPDSFFLVMAIARRLPERTALQQLVDLTGVRWIVRHDPRDAEGAWPETAGGGLSEAMRWPDAVLYRVSLAQTLDFRGAIAWPAVEPVTLTGVPVAPLPPEAMRGALEVLEVPSVVRPGWTVRGEVRIVNGSDRSWPGFRPAPAGLLHVGYRWLDEQGTLLDAPARLTRVPVDLRPGESVRVPFALQAPSRGGTYRLRVTLVQLGGAWFDEHGGPAADARVEVRP